MALTLQLLWVVKVTGSLNLTHFTPVWNDGFLMPDCENQWGPWETFQVTFGLISYWHGWASALSHLHWWTQQPKCFSARFWCSLCLCFSLTGGICQPRVLGTGRISKRQRPQSRKPTFKCLTLSRESLCLKIKTWLRGQQKWERRQIGKLASCFASKYD